MSIGIPKIAITYRNKDGFMKTDWVDVYEKLLEERILFLSEIIDSSTMIQMLSLLLFLSKSDEDIYLYISSPGGGAQQAISIYDAMNAIRPDVCTLLMGFATLSPSLILTGGAAGKRGALPHSRVMIHQVDDHFSGLPDILELGLDGMLELHDTIVDIYADTTGQRLSVIEEDLEIEKVMSATEAKAYGIIDFISKKVEKRDKDEMEKERRKYEEWVYW
uniref:ATP-dependent Clp protease proteolytic subunit n=1 Tax=Juncus fauriei TaxID=2980169 RepID=A0AAU7AN13_9POAL